MSLLTKTSQIHCNFLNKNLSKKIYHIKNILGKKTKLRVKISINKRPIDKFLSTSFIHLVKQSNIKAKYLPLKEHIPVTSQMMLINRSFFSAQVIADYIACQLTLPVKSKDFHFRNNFKKGISVTLNSFFKLEESKNVLGLMFVCSGR